MSHNLATINGQTACAVASERGLPWHRLGQTVVGAMTWEEAIEKAQLNWTVSKHQLSVGTSLVPAWGILRDTDQAYLGTVGKQYTPFQNRDAFSFVDSLLETNSAHYESAGTLGKGEIVWCLARVGDGFKIRNTSDEHHTYLLFASSHNGTLSTTARLTTVRVVCQNTLTSALSRGAESSVIRIKHTPNGAERMEAARDVLMNVQNDVTTLKLKLDNLAEKKMTQKSYTEVMEKIFGERFYESSRKSAAAIKITELFESNDRNTIPEIRGTAYNLLNACTEYADHFSTVRLTEHRVSEGGNVETVRAQSAIFGTAESWKKQALDAIIDATIGAPMHDPLQGILEKVQVN